MRRVRESDERSRLKLLSFFERALHMMNSSTFKSHITNQGCFLLLVPLTHIQMVAIVAGSPIPTPHPSAILSPVDNPPEDAPEPLLLLLLLLVMIVLLLPLMVGGCGDGSMFVVLAVIDAGFVSEGGLDACGEVGTVGKAVGGMVVVSERMEMEMVHGR